MDQGTPANMTESAFVAISITPRLVAVCIKHGSATGRELRSSSASNLRKTFHLQGSELVTKVSSARLKQRHSGRISVSIATRVAVTF